MDKLAERANRELISAARSGDRLRFVEAYVAVILYVPLAKQRNEATKPDLFDCNYLPTNKYHHHLQQAIKPVSYNHPPSDADGMAKLIERDRLEYRIKKTILENSFMAGFTIHDLDSHLQSIQKRGNPATLMMQAWLMVTIYQWWNPKKPLRDVFKILARNSIPLADRDKTSAHWSAANWRKVYEDATRLIAGDGIIFNHVHWIELQTKAEQQAAKQTKQLDDAIIYETSKPRRLYSLSEERRKELGSARMAHQASKDYNRKLTKLLGEVEGGNFDNFIKIQQDIIRAFAL